LAKGDEGGFYNDVWKISSCPSFSKRGIRIHFYYLNLSDALLKAGSFYVLTKHTHYDCILYANDF